MLIDNPITCPPDAIPVGALAPTANDFTYLTATAIDPVHQILQIVKTANQSYKTLDAGDRNLPAISYLILEQLQRATQLVGVTIEDDDQQE